MKLELRRLIKDYLQTESPVFAQHMAYLIAINDQLVYCHYELTEIEYKSFFTAIDRAIQYANVTLELNKEANKMKEDGIPIPEGIIPEYRAKRIHKSCIIAFNALKKTLEKYHVMQQQNEKALPVEKASKFDTEKVKDLFSYKFLKDYEGTIDAVKVLIQRYNKEEIATLSLCLYESTNVKSIHKKSFNAFYSYFCEITGATTLAYCRPNRFRAKLNSIAAKIPGL